MKLTSPSVVAEVLRRHGLSLKRSLGQNFLVDENILAKVISAVDPRESDCVVEFGPGIGTLTVALAPLCRRVVAIELDRSLIPVAEAHTAHFGNVTVFRADAAKIDLKAAMERVEPATTAAAGGGAARPWKVVSNLPYYATSPIIVNVLFSGAPVNRLVFMVQKEVARRIVAGPGDEAYGAFSVACQYWTTPRVYSSVPRAAFMPAPEVDSAIVVMDVREEPPAGVADQAFFFKVVRASFGQRRKTLAAALRGLFGRDSVRGALESAGIEPARRAETLSIPEFAELARALGAEFAKGKTQC
ncbi:MAG: 16S rRNA (adenine(1518)-N(6)/adenine(1519)-N(6))-dimethyltransferase RsmA [Firmicutes bacterium]|nr:16S rRNA (adenine(1518)-N(6)/adenine(1519)-N(6))-dimethyltransferase RsmA [Bacillota bacterium]